MGGGASVLAARESEAKLQASMFDVFDLLGAQAIPTTKQIATVVANAAQAIAHAGLAMLFFKDEIKMQLLYLPPGAKDFEAVELDKGMMGGPGFVGQVAMNGALFNESEGSALWDAVSGSEPSFKHCKERVTGCMCVPVKTVDQKVVGVIVTLNGAEKGGFTMEHARSVSELASKVVPLVTRFGSDVAYSKLSDDIPGDAGLRSMLGNFGRGDKRDVKQMMKKRVRQLINVRRLSAHGIGEVLANAAGQDKDTSPSDEAKEVLEQMSGWGPAVLHLETEKMGMMAEVMVNDLGLHTEFEIPVGSVAKFATSILSTYNDNPYHNQWHGFVVFQSCYWAIKSCKIVSTCTNHLEQLAMLVAAIGHDAKHDGVNNAFHVQSMSDLTMMYNDQSPLENLHSRTTYECLKQDGCNVFEQLDTEQWHQARSIVCQSILHTDMSKHPTTVTMLKSRKDFSADEDKDRADMCNAVLHAMDLANVAYPWPECVKWARRVGTEFSQQVEKEKAAKIPVSVFMDVHGDVQLAKLQVGFVNYVIMPFFEIVTHHIEEFKVVSVQCRDNVLTWGKIASGEATLAEDGSVAETASGETALAEDGTATEAGQPPVDSARTATSADPAESQP